MMKKNLKKAVSLALASVMAFSLTACSGGSGTTTAAQADGKEAGSGTGDVTIEGVSLVNHTHNSGAVAPPDK